MESGAPMTKIEPLESIHRALEVLRILNRYNGLTISELARLAGMPRAAVNRYVVTFAELGYVYRVDQTRSIRVSSRTLELSLGAKTDDRIALSAYPQMKALCREIGWPLSLDGIRAARLTVLHTTDVESPLVVKGITAQQTFPLVGTAAGHVLLALLSPTLRADILATALLEDRPLLRRAGFTPDALEHQFAEVRRLGYAYQRLSRVNWSVISVPIITEEAVQFSLDVRYRTSAIPFEAAVARFVPKLTTTAASIARELSKAGASAEAAPIDRPAIKKPARVGTQRRKPTS